MARLIDADELEKILGNHWNIEDDQEFCNKTVWRCLREAPTVDAVEVVRCGDCKWWTSTSETRYFEVGVCAWDNTKSTNSHYCSMGDRKDEVEE